MIKIIVLVIFLHSAHSVADKSILWRQNYNNINYPQYGLLQHPQTFNQNPPSYGQSSFMGALNSLAQNDQLQCVPRLLCELTSGRTPNDYNRQFGLPFNINLDSFLGLLGAVNGAKISPIFQFGRAALLGYTSKGNSALCMYAYPECPRDPDRLVEYLNNYNGGFFRYFNGLPQKHQHYRNDIQKRILTKPSPFIFHAGIRFPNEAITNERKHFIFPQENDHRRPKTIFGQIPFLPDRTGTGELRLDPAELDSQNHKNLFSFPSNDL